MTDRELGLFTLIDDARVDHGCARLGRDTALTTSARAHAAEDPFTPTGNGTEAIAEGKNARDAFSRMMDAYRDTLLDCGLTDLGVGYAQEQSKDNCEQGSCIVRRWVADFD